MERFFWAILLVIGGSIDNSWAAFISLHEAIKQAQEFSPDIKGLRNQYESAQAKTRQTLAPAEPSLSIQYNDMRNSLDPSNPGSTVYQINQPFAFPGKAFINHSINSHQAQSIFHQVRFKELDVANSVKNAYWNLALAKKNIELNANTRALYGRIIAIAKRRYESGSITQVDFLNAQITLYGSENDLADLAAGEKATRAQLNILLGQPIDTEFEVSPIQMDSRPLMAIEEAMKKMLAQRPELHAAVELSAAAESNYTLAKMSLLPDFQFIAGTTNYNLLAASPINSVSGQQQTFLVGLQFTFPLWGFLNEKESIRAASHDRMTAEFAQKSLELQSRLAVKTAVEALDAQRKKIKSYENHLMRLSEQAINLALVSYSSGKIDFQGLAETESSRRQILHDYYALVVSYLTGFSQFGQLIGEDL